MVIHLPKWDDTIFAEGGKTDKLLADLEAQRHALGQLHADSVTKGVELSEVAADLQLMEEKTAFLAEMIDKTQGVFVPPPKGEAEVSMLALQQHVFGNISKFSRVTGLMAAPLVFEALVWVGQKAGWVKTSGRTARFVNSSAFTKVSKFAKGAAALAFAVEAAGFVIKMLASKEQNDNLRAELNSLKAKTAKGQKDYQSLVKTLTDAKAQRDEMLTQAGASSPEDFVRTVNEGLAELGRQKANFDTARRMMQHNLTDDMILSMVDGLTPEALADLKLRLRAEQMLAAGQLEVVVAAELGLDAEQVAGVAVMVAARNAIVRGDSTENLPIGAGQLEDIEEQLDESLPDNWAAIEGSEPLDALATSLLLNVEALQDLRQELRGKAQLSAGADVGVVSEATGQPRAEVVAWASALPISLEAVRAQREGGVTEPSDLAAANRLPLSLIAA